MRVAIASPYHEGLVVDEAMRFLPRCHESIKPVESRFLELSNISTLGP